MTRSREYPSPPGWWKHSLYDFLEETMPLQGWIWEFMRRARLKEILKPNPVDAMNPNPDLQDVNPIDWDYYKSWPNKVWPLSKPTFLKPAVLVEPWLNWSIE